LRARSQEGGQFSLAAFQFSCPSFDLSAIEPFHSR
jgi:hypothetical protein